MQYQNIKRMKTKDEVASDCMPVVFLARSGKTNEKHLLTLTVDLFCGHQRDRVPRFDGREIR